jgi:hypothetical protein
MPNVDQNDFARIKRFFHLIPIHKNFRFGNNIIGRVQKSTSYDFEGPEVEVGGISHNAIFIGHFDKYCACWVGQVSSMSFFYKGPFIARYNYNDSGTAEICFKFKSNSNTYR